MTNSELKCVITDKGTRKCIKVLTNVPVDISDVELLLPGLELLGTKVVYEDSVKTSLSSPANGVNNAKAGLDQFYPGISGDRDSADLTTGLPVGTNYVIIAVQDFTMRHVMNHNPNTPARAYHLRDNGMVATSGQIITLESISEIEAFKWVSDLVPSANPTTAKVIIKYYNRTK